MKSEPGGTSRPHYPNLPVPTTGKMTGSELMELDDFCGQPGLRGYPDAAVFWQAHIQFARRCTLAIATGDLYAALRASRISTHALALHYQRGGTMPEPA